MSLDKPQALIDAKQHVLQHNTQAAIEVYRKIVDDDPTDVAAKSALGDLFLSTGQVQDALAQFSRVADTYIEGGLTRMAIETLKKIVAIDPGNTATALKLAELYAQAGLPSEARQHYLQISDTLNRNGATREAINVYSKVVHLDPSNTSTRIKLAELYLREGLSEPAYEGFITAAEQLAAKGENRRALNAYNEALAIKPDSRDAAVAARKLMALLGLQSPDPTNTMPVPKVAGSFDKSDFVEHPRQDMPKPLPAADTNPSSDGYVVQEISKAEILVAYGKVSQAVSMLRNVVAQRPDNVDVHIKLKDIFLRNGMMSEAAKECAALERIFEARGESERARDYAVRASRLSGLLEHPSGELAESGRKPAAEGQPVLNSAQVEPPRQPKTNTMPQPVLTKRPVETVTNPNAVITKVDKESGAAKPPITAPPKLNTRPKPPQTTADLSSYSPAKVVDNKPVAPATKPENPPVPISTPSEVTPVAAADGKAAISPPTVATAIEPRVSVPTGIGLTVSAPSVSSAVETPAAMPTATELTVSPSEASALIPVSRVSTVTRERPVPVLFANSQIIEDRRVSLKMLGIAAGVLVLLGGGAVIGGLVYDSHLDKQYAVLSSAAPALAELAPPPAFEESTEPAPETEAITVDVNANPRNEEPSQRNKPEPPTIKLGQAAPPQPAAVTTKAISQPTPAPPRAVASPDARLGADPRAPSGVPGEVPLGAAQPGEPPAPKLIRQSAGVVLGGAIRKVEPVYPSTARESRQSGSVAVEVTISEQGNVVSARALSGPLLLRGPAVNAARAWKFKASTLGGVPVTTTTTIVFNFKL